MPGRMNPREYDLGELRDAVREKTRQHSDALRAPEGGGSRAAVSGLEPIETVVDGAEATVSPTEDPEAYLQARFRRRRLGENGAETNDEHRKHRQGPPRTRNRNTRSSESDRRIRTTKAERPRKTDANLSLLSHRPGGNISKPYLKELPGTYAAQLEIFEWLDQLVAKVGSDGAISALEYYESIEWLSAESRSDLESFVDGFESRSGTDGGLGISDHRESLEYVARLAGRLSS